MELLNVKKVGKRSLEATVSIKIAEWGLTIREIGLFEKNGKRWISFPSRKYEKDGKTEYFSYIFMEKEVKERLAKAIFDLYDKQADSCEKSDLDDEEAPF